MALGPIEEVAKDIVCAWLTGPGGQSVTGSSQNIGEGIGKVYKAVHQAVKECYQKE